MNLFDSLRQRAITLFRPVEPPPARITVLIPTCNRGARLERAIASALDTAPPGVCIHVFDNASTDDTQARIRRMIRAGLPIHYRRHAENLGPIANFQAALNSVVTEFFVPLADDDWLEPGFLKAALAQLDGHGEIGAAIFITRAQNEQGQVLDAYPQAMDQRRKGRLEPGEHLAEWLRFGHYHWSSVLWRREVLNTVGFPFLHVGLPSDVDFQARAFAHWPVVLVDAVGAGYLIHDGQHGGALSIEHLPAWARIFRALDRAILGDGLIPPADYAHLRRIARDRYLGLWRRGTPPAAPAILGEMALAAGLDLDDWDFAYHLAALAEAAAPEGKADWPAAGPPHWSAHPSQAAAAFDRLLITAARQMTP
jgi:glycosyltransferase involved in cell wall biosynthesis